MNHPIQHTISRKECVERRTDEPNLKGMEGGGVAVPLRLQRKRDAASGNFRLGAQRPSTETRQKA